MAQALEILEAGNSATNINIYELSRLFSGTTMTITWNANNAGSIQSYSYKLEKLTYNVLGGTTFTATTLINTTYTASLSQAFTGLTPGEYYRVTARSFTGSNGSGQNGNLVAWDVVLPKSSSNAAIIETASPLNPVNGNVYSGTPFGQAPQYGYSPTGVVEYNGTPFGQAGGNTGPISSFESAIQVPPDSGNLANKLYYTIPGNYIKNTKSLFILSQPSTNNYAYTTAYKSFSQLDTSKSYYLFGTNLFFDATIDKPNQSGGMSFFVSNDGMDGYYIELQTTASSASLSSSKQFQIFRIKGGVKSELVDSQVGISKTLAGVYGGQIYKIDVKVFVESGQRTIVAYINGFKVTAIDSSADILPITDKVAMVCKTGTVYFDYIYGMHISEDSYNQDSLINVYEGKYPKNIISFLYGERVSINDPDITPTNSGFIEEFGAVARELRVIKVKYESRPAFPIYASAGINSFVKIIGQRLTSSGAEVYVLNNSGTYIPLDDSQYYSFYILGNYISQSGEIEYVENSAGEYSAPEPVTFTSTWIQKNSDVVGLANWIKNVWSKKQSILDMAVFGNPLLTIGDVIVVHYPYLGLTTSQKFLITDISHSYSEGLETSIICRTL